MSMRTKEWFKNQLVSHGIPLPASTSRKEEYQRLYEEQVLPNQSNTEFSSDDDSEQPMQDEPRAPSVSKNAKPDTIHKNDSSSHEEKHLAWVERMNDRNVFDALTACQRNPGPIVATTREFYRKMLLDLLNSDERKTMDNIEEYLGQEQEAKEQWLASGLELGHSFNGVTNGNTENGFSDTDDEEAVETASRHSRASSKRATPARAPRSPMKGVAPSTPVSTHKSSFDQEMRSRRTIIRDRMFENEETDELPGTSYDSKVFLNTVSPSSSLKYSSPYMRKRAMDFYEETSASNLEEVPVTKKQGGRVPSTNRLILCLLLIILVAATGFVFYTFNQTSECTGPECGGDELDELIKNLEEAGGPTGGEH